MGGGEGQGIMDIVVARVKGAYEPEGRGFQ